MVVTHFMEKKNGRPVLWDGIIGQQVDPYEEVLIALAKDTTEACVVFIDLFGLMRNCSIADNNGRNR